MKLYAAKLLFQFRVVVNGDSGKRRLCEERIIHISARSGRRALLQAERKARASEHSYTNSEGNAVHFEFVGTLELLQLGLECEEGEVWYEMRERLLPMERKDRIIPRPRQLCAIRVEARERISRAVRGGPRR